jgi:hypothetical protein
MRLVPIPERERELMIPISEFRNVISGMFTDYDGHGHPATLTHYCQQLFADLTAIEYGDFPMGFTHILWFNK